MFTATEDQALHVFLHSCAWVFFSSDLPDPIFTSEIWRGEKGSSPPFLPLRVTWNRASSSFSCRIVEVLPFRKPCSQACGFIFTLGVVLTCPFWVRAEKTREHGSRPERGRPDSHVSVEETERERDLREMFVQC